MRITTDNHRIVEIDTEHLPAEFGGFLLAYIFQDVQQAAGLLEQIKQVEVGDMKEACLGWNIYYLTISRSNACLVVDVPGFEDYEHCVGLSEFKDMVEAYQSFLLEI